MKHEICVVGLDTGTRKSLGYVILDFIVSDNIKEYFKNFKKSYLKNPEKRSKCFKDLFFTDRKFLSYSVISYGVLDFSPEKRKESVESILAHVRSIEDSFKNNSFNSVSLKVIFGIEDFLFFNLDKKYKRRYNVKPASWFTVARMQNVIGFIEGSLFSYGYQVKLVKPKVWKSLVPYCNLLAASLNLDLKKFNRSERSHIFSAIGIAFYTMFDFLQNQLHSSMGNISCSKRMDNFSQ